MKRSLLFVILAILALSLGVCGCDIGKHASVGDVKLVSARKQYAPINNFLYSRDRDGLFADGRQKQPQDIADELDVIPVSDDVRIIISGKKTGSSYTLYNERYQTIYDRQEEFVMPEESGRYMICVNVMWGTRERYEGYEYFFMVEK